MLRVRIFVQIAQRDGRGFCSSVAALLQLRWRDPYLEHATAFRLLLQTIFAAISVDLRLRAALQSTSVGEHLKWLTMQT